MLAALLALSPAAPLLAAGPRETEAALVAAYADHARAELAEARGFLESLEELFLTPHGTDEPVEAALLHLDLAGAYLDEAQRAALRGLGDEAPAAWSPFEERVAAARALLRRAAPDLDAAYDAVPILARPLEGDTLALYNVRGREVRLRGYFAVNAVPAEYLAALLAHEAAHALAARKAEEGGGRYRPSFEDELAARRRETEVWTALKAGRERDFGGLESDQARSVQAGEKALRGFILAAAAAQRDWTWVTPPTPAPAPTAASSVARSSAPPEPLPEPAAEDDLRRSAGLVRDMRRNLMEAAEQRLDAGRETLAQLPEAAAPFPRIVNFQLMQVRALEERRYPAAMYAAFQALYPVMTELDRARAVLGRSDVGTEERTLLARYAAGRNGTPREWGGGERREAERLLRLTRGGKALAKRLRGMRIVSVRYPQPDLERPDALAVPGSWLFRSTQPAIAACWLAHELVHRAQGLAAGAAPSTEQELDAQEAALTLWQAAGADRAFDRAHPDRFLRERVFWQTGGREALRRLWESPGGE